MSEEFESLINKPEVHHVNVQTEKPGFTRNVHSKALLATDVNALNAHRNRKRVYQSQNEEINSIKSEVNEIKDMLRQLLDRK